MSIYLYGDYILDAYYEKDYGFDDIIECPGGASNVEYSLIALAIANAIAMAPGSILKNVLNRLNRISYDEHIALESWKSLISSTNYWKNKKITSRKIYNTGGNPRRIEILRNSWVTLLGPNIMIISDYNRGTINFDKFLNSNFPRDKMDIVLIDDKYKRNVINQKGLFSDRTIFVIKHEKTEKDFDIPLILKSYKEADYLVNYVILNLNNKIYLLDIDLQEVAYCFEHEPNDTSTYTDNTSGAGDVFMASLSYHLINRYSQRPIKECLAEAIPFAHEIAKGSCQLSYTGFYKCLL